MHYLVYITNIRYLWIIRFVYLNLPNNAVQRETLTHQIQGVYICIGQDLTCTL
jgi:hypothetical protein